MDFKSWEWQFLLNDVIPLWLVLTIFIIVFWLTDKLLNKRKEK